MRYMTIFMLILIVCTSSVQAWDVNTHRGIDQVALGGQVVNLENFINNAQIRDKTYENEKYDGYFGTTYFKFITQEHKPTREFKFKFETYNYMDLIEAGSILEDATWPGWNFSFPTSSLGMHTKVE